MIEWIQGNEAAVWWLIMSGISFVATLIAVPLILIQVPADYFMKVRRERPHMIKRHPAIRITLILLRNLLGYLFMLAGLLMLALPGQGLLTFFVGILLADFPGKDRFIRWLISQGGVHRTIDWLRRKAGREPLILSDYH